MNDPRAAAARDADEAVARILKASKVRSDEGPGRGAADDVARGPVVLRPEGLVQRVADGDVLGAAVVAADVQDGDVADADADLDAQVHLRALGDGAGAAGAHVIVRVGPGAEAGDGVVALVERPLDLDRALRRTPRKPGHDTGVPTFLHPRVSVVFHSFVAQSWTSDYLSGRT